MNRMCKSLRVKAQEYGYKYLIISFKNFTTHLKMFYLKFSFYATIFLVFSNDANCLFQLSIYTIIKGSKYFINSL